MAFFGLGMVRHMLEERRGHRSLRYTKINRYLKQLIFYYVGIDALVVPPNKFALIDDNRPPSPFKQKTIPSIAFF